MVDGYLHHRVLVDRQSAEPRHVLAEIPNHARSMRNVVRDPTTRRAGVEECGGDRLKGLRDANRLHELRSKDEARLDRHFCACLPRHI